MSVSFSVVTGGSWVEPETDYSIKAKREGKYNGGETLERCSAVRTKKSFRAADNVNKSGIVHKLNATLS